MADFDITHMRRALELARRGAWSAHPNPFVGAVVASGAEVLGEGWHEAAGGPHAEAAALANAGSRSIGATIYVTLEPCAHTGRTPPCADAIAEAGIRRVVYAIEDPDTAVAGGGAAKLAAAGVEVVSGVLGGDAAELNAAYLIHRKLGRPRVTYKAAMTLDGRTAAPDGSSQWISGPESREEVQRFRAEADGIAVGIGTVMADNPSLTCRLAGYTGELPARIVFDSDGALPKGARVADGGGPTWVVTTAGGAKEIEARHGDSVESIITGAGPGGVDLGEALAVLGSRGILELLVEGGATLAGALLSEQLLDRCVLFVAPSVLGGNSGKPLFGGETRGSLADALAMDFQSTTQVGNDLLVVAVPRHAKTQGRDSGTGRAANGS